MFSKYDVTLHILSFDSQTGVADMEVCVRDALHIGIYRTTMMFFAPCCLVKAIGKATDDLLEQHSSQGGNSENLS